MKKLVNGKIVDIKNIELFEKAEEGIILAKIAASSINTKLTAESGLLNECIKHYEIIYKSMPYPLYAIEDNIKYSAIATFIKDLVSEPLHMWVDDALFICIDKSNNLVLKLVSNTWGLVNINCDKTDNTLIENFQHHLGYREYNWLLRKIMNKESTSSFYQEFMPEFVKACNNQPMIMKWELMNILTFGAIPEKLELKENRIINLETKALYTIDIFSAGMKKTTQNEYVMSLFDTTNEIKLRPKYVKTYAFEAYEKPFSDTDTQSASADKLKKNNITGLTNLFNTLCSIRIALEKNEFEKFEGFISDRDLIYSVNGRLFVCKAYKISETQEIAKGIELYSYDRGLIYFTKNISLGRGVKKEIIYSYSLKDGNLRICKVQFSA